MLKITNRTIVINIVINEDRLRLNWDQARDRLRGKSSIEAT